MQLTLKNARLIDATQDLASGTLSIENTRIVDQESTSGAIIDASDSIVLPGFIEVHTHGGHGFNLHTTDINEIHSYARWVPETGVTAFLIGVVGTPNALPASQLQTAVQAIKQSSTGHELAAEAVGIHMEGPYISLKRRGAHSPSWLRTPDPQETERILELTQGQLQLITLAPELPGAHEMIRRLVSAGVTVSIGHTDADYQQAQEAIKLGITHATHVFNAMRPLLHRDPGPIAAIAEAPQVLGELISDGIHVEPAVMDILVRLLGPKRVIVITDALAGAGLPENATFNFGGQVAHVICGAARLEDGTLTGTVLTLDQALHNILDITHVSLQEASCMLSYNPALSAHVAQRKGLLKAGYDADLLIYDQSLRLQATICRGQLAFATEAWRSRLSGN